MNLRFKKSKALFLSLALSCSFTGSSLFAQNTTKNLVDTARIIDEVFFRITAITRMNADSATVTLSEGYNQGIFTGAKGNAMTSHNVKEAVGRPSTIYVGSLTITSVEKESSTGIITFYTKYKSLELFPQDLVAVEIHPVKNFEPTLFSNLASLDIIFLDNEREEIHTKQDLLQNIKPTDEKKILAEFTSVIITFADELKTYDDSTFNTVYKSGTYKGKTMKSIFSEATDADVSAFLNFVKSFPGKYMGNKWKLNETFATWVLNNAPSASSNRQWLIELVEEIPTSDLSKFVTKNKWFIENDTLIQWIERLNTLQVANKNKEALALNNKFISIANQLNDKAAEIKFYYYRSFSLEALGQSEEALKDMIVAYNFDKKNIDYKYALANQYGKMEMFKECFQLYDELLKELPSNTNILGNIGWYKTAAGMLDEAIPYCRSAYLKEPDNVSFTVNYAHTFLLKGNIDSAKFYYNKTLENLYHPSDYTNGPKSDFELFFKKGWERQYAAAMADMMDSAFNEKYYALTRSNELWNDAKAQYEKQDYGAAAEIWKNYIRLFDNAKNPPQDYLHNANNWIGTSYWTVKMYDSAAKYYQRGLAISKEFLVANRNPQTNKDNDFLVLDYGRLYNFYNGQKKMKLADEYKTLHAAETQKVAELYANPALHIISLSGSNNVTHFSGKENATLFYDSFKQLKKNQVNAAFTKLMDGKNLTREKLMTELENVRKQSKPEDIFIFYYAGETIVKNNQPYISFNSTDSSNGVIAVSDLMDYLDLVYANKKLLVCDQPNPAFLSFIASRYVNAGNSASEIIFLSPGVETPVDEKGLSLFTQQLVQTATDLQKEGNFSAKDFVDKASYTIGRGQHYLPVLSFAYGKDFLLFENKTDSTESKTAIKTGTRGFKVEEKSGSSNDASVTGPQKNYAILFATDNYEDKNFNKLVNPINDAIALKDLLQNSFDFEVQLVKNPTRDEVEKWLSEYRDNKRYGPNDQLFVFFAGHGVYYDNAKMGYLVTRDSKAEDATHKTYLSYSDLGNIYLKNIACNRIFLVLDACFAGSFFDNNSVRGTPMEINAKNLSYLKKTANNQRFFKGISSGGKQYVADGKEGQHSPFAASFLNVLFNKALQKNFVTADEIIGEIKSNPPAATAICEGNFHYSDPLSHFIFELKSGEKKSGIKSDSIK